MVRSDNPRPPVPFWNDVIATGGRGFPWLQESREQKVGRIEVVSHHGAAIPAIVLRYPDKSFRETPSNAIPVEVRLDIVTMQPFPTPFAYVMPIVFDDAADPFWKLLFLHLFPIVSLNGVPVVTFDELRFSGRDIVEMFCKAGGRCGFLLVNEKNEIRIAKIVTCGNLTEERRTEISDVLAFMNRFDISKDHEECVLPIRAFGDAFCALIRTPHGPPVIVPKNRSPMAAEATIYSLAVEHNRLLDRRGLSAYLTVPATRFDLFISHAHADQRATDAIKQLLTSTWPELRIAATKPGDDETFRKNPLYFADDARASKVLLYLATPNSIARGMVHLELAGNAGKPMVTALLGITRRELLEYFKDNMFTPVETEAAFDVATAAGQEKLVQAIAARLGRPPPIRVQNAISVAAGDAPSDSASPTANLENFLRDYHFMTSHRWRQQSEAEAEAIVDRVVEMSSLNPVSSSPRGKLIQCLTYFDNVTPQRLLLEGVPALVDDSLLIDFRRMVAACTGGAFADALKRLESLEPLIVPMVESLNELRRRSDGA